MGRVEEAGEYTIAALCTGGKPGGAVAILLRFYKPFGVLSQFTDRALGRAPDAPPAARRAVLADYIDLSGVYPAGRLDRDSEGLLLLTDHGPLQARIAEPRHKLEKVYWAQVEGQPDATEVARLATVLHRGVALKDGRARAAALRPLEPPDLPGREPPVTPHRARVSSWLEIVLTSGRNRQVRRMLAAVGLPVLRLHRARIGPVTLDGLQPGEFESIAVPEELQRGPRQPRRHRASTRAPGRGHRG